MAGSLTQLTVLMVDDSAHIRRLLATMLRTMGCTNLIEARNIEQALATLERKPVDIALIDWMLDDPAGSGMDLVKQIRASPHEHLAFLPIIMMTGHTERDNIELARDMGVTEFLAKPFTAKGLHTRLSMLIDQPRPFIRTRQYFGPDRRRRQGDPGPQGERRLSGPKRQKA
jgi:DNA-binding response OmpR family regulator